VVKVLCGDDDTHWAYFEKWIAQMIQQPGNIIGISVLLKSIEGCGKGFICEVIKKIIGDEYFYQSGNAETDVFNRFSTALRFRIFININECKAKTNYDYNDLIKHIITAPSITYEEKGKQSIVIRNCARLLFTTNNDFAMPITEDERRFVIFECSTKYKGDAEKWNKLFRYIENCENGFRVCRYLRRWSFKSCRSSSI
jgi:putative DNA primase/helicase